MAKSDARFEYKANLARTDFDLSQRLGFTAPAGSLLPVWFDFASPGDSYYMQHDLPLLRSAVLAAPAMVDVKVHFETFFVPMQMLLQPFENIMFSLKNLQSSNFNGRTLTKNAFPLWDFSTFVSNVKANHASDDVRVDAFRICDLLGLNAMNFLTVVNSPSTDPKALNGLYQYAPNFFPYQLLAYQTIFQYYYRLDDKSEFTPTYANWDVNFGAAAPVGSTAYPLVEIHQRPWEFDYFTSMYRSPIVSNANLQAILGINPDVVESDLTVRGSMARAIGGNGSITDNEDVANFSTPNTPTFNNEAINTATLRQMFASEKLAMITGRTKKNYDSQVLAHYGVNVPHDVKHDITMIHHDMYDLTVQEVTALAESVNQPLGELAGKSYAHGDGKQFKFQAPCHGVMMTIFSVEPKKRYFGGFDKINAVVDAFDFPTPEFDRLGNVPMYRYETGMIPATGGSYDMSDLIGWKERYYQNKRKYDKTTYAFGHGVTAGTVNNYSSYMLAFRPFAPYEPTITGSSSTASRPDVENRFYIERNAMDALCVVGYHYGWLEQSGGEDWSVTPWMLYARDPFIVNSNIQCKKVSWMSKDGEPIYNY